MRHHYVPAKKRYFCETKSVVKGGAWHRPPEACVVELKNIHAIWQIFQRQSIVKKKKKAYLPCLMDKLNANAI